MKLDKVREGKSPLNNLHDLLFACSTVRYIVDVKNKVLFFFSAIRRFSIIYGSYQVFQSFREYGEDSC